MAKRTITTLLGATIALLARCPCARHAGLRQARRRRTACQACFVADDDGTQPAPGRPRARAQPCRPTGAGSPGSRPATARAREDASGRPQPEGAQRPERGRGQRPPVLTRLQVARRRRRHAAVGLQHPRPRVGQGRFRQPARVLVLAGLDGRVRVLAGKNESFDAETDLYSFEIANEQLTRITRDRKSLNPLWTPAGIIYDRQRIGQCRACPTTCSRSSRRRQPAPDHRLRSRALQRPVPLELSAERQPPDRLVRGPGHRASASRSTRRPARPTRSGRLQKRLRGRRSGRRRPTALGYTGFADPP